MKKGNSKLISKQHIHGKILVQLALLTAMFVFIGGFITYDVITNHLGTSWVIISALVGILIGIAVGRMFALKWHEDTQKVILTMDKLGFLLIAVYIVFRIFSEQLLGSILHGEELTAVTFSLLAGLMLGRLLSILTSIKKILVRQGIL